MTDSSAPGLHWLIVAQISDPPSLRTVPLADLVEQLGFTAQVDLGPALGAAAELKTEVALPRLRSFSIAGVLAAAGPLAELAALSERLGGPPSKRPAASELLAAVLRIAGEGKLHADLSALLGEAPAPAPAPAAAPPASADLVDELLGQAAAPAPVRDRPAAIVDAIVRSSAKPDSGKAGALRSARDRLDAALAAAARAALDDPAVRQREALWRALKLVHEQCPRGPGPRVSVLDADLAGLALTLDAYADEAPMDRPDAVFLADTLAGLGPLHALAERAASMMVPLVVSLEPAALGRNDLAGLVALADAEPEIPPVWAELRADEDARWLAAAVNPVALVADGAAADRRVVFGAPALGLAALLSASQRDTSGLASLARPGAVRAPTNWEPSSGPDAGTSIPTERFAPLRAQARLASLGLIALGSPRGGDSLVVAACPTLRAGDDAVSLPAQILTGRIVRFSLWAAGQATAGASAGQLEALFQQAASLVLFPDLSPEVAALRASVDAAKRQVTVGASVHPTIAGARLEIEFTLPVAVDLS